MQNFISCLVFLVCSCSYILGQNIPQSKLFTIHLAANISNQEEIGLKEIAENIEYVKLEYKPECAISRINWLVATEKYFFVSDNRGIFQFERSGKFIREIGKLGRGPNEYPNLTDFAVDESSQRIYILPNTLRQIKVFDFNGTYINSIQLNSYRYNEAIDIIDKGVIALQSGMNVTSLVSTEIINEQGKSILQFKSRIYQKIDGSITGKNINVTYRFNDNFFVKELKNDTVYKMTLQGLIPHYVFDLGKLKPPETYPYEERGKYVEIYRIFETDDYIFAFLTYKNTIGVIRYNKSTKEVVTSLPPSKEKSGIKNDFDNGLNYYMTSVPRSLDTNQKEWLLPLSPNSLYEFKNDTKITGNFKILINRYDLNDNPAIMIIKLK